MNILIQALTTEVTQEELEKNLPPEVMKNLVGKTITPYIIGEEGESNPRIIGEGIKKLTWPRAVIRRIADVAKSGTKFFIGHNSDSSHDNRQSVGEVVGSFTREVKGKLQALAISILDKGQEAMDVCSIEADVEMSPSGMIGDINKLTGIALGSSNTDSPAFPGAVRLNSIQCFGETKTSLEKGDIQVTFEELKAAAKALNVHPHQLFTAEDIQNDKVLGKVYTDLETVNKELTTKSEALTTLESSSKESIRKGQLADAKNNFSKLIPEGTTEKAKTFILAKFDPEKVEDLTEEGLKNMLSSLQTEYSDNAKLFGVEDSNPGSKGGTTKPGGESEDPIAEAVKEIMG